MTPPATDKIYDLIIVGGGPAGAAAALYSKRYKLKTLLLERAKFPRDKICGDAFSGKALTILQELGLIEKVSDLPGATIHTVTFGSPKGNKVNVDLRHSSHREFHTGYVIQRQIFDTFLFREAQKVADKTLENFTVTGLIQEDGRVCGIRGKQGNNSELVEFRGRILLGADGFSSIVARKTGLYNHTPHHWIVALRCYYQNVEGLTNQIELHYMDKFTPGYFWIFPLENGYANVGLGMLHSFIKKQKINLRDILKRTIESDRFKDRFTNATPLESPIGWNLPVGSIHREICGDGFMLLGDAAGLIDPFTGEGIGNALYSARFAAKCAREACDARDFSKTFLERYDKRLWNEIGDELNISSKLQKVGRISPLLNFVINKAEKNQEISDIICGMITKEIPQKHLISPFFYLKLLFK